MNRREFIAGLGGAAAWPLAVRAQQGDRVRRIGVLMTGDENDPVNKTYVPAFTRALAGLGWSDGRNMRMDVRWYGDDINRIRALAQELVSLRPDIIVPSGTPATAAVQGQTRTIPIVFANVAEPVASASADDTVSQGVAGRAFMPEKPRQSNRLTVVLGSRASLSQPDARLCVRVLVRAGVMNHIPPRDDISLIGARNMATQINLLDNATVKSLTQPGRHADGGNLFLVVHASGARNWVLYYRDPIAKDRLGNGKRTELGLGGFPFVSLAQARAKATKARALLGEQPPRSPKLVWAEHKRLANIPTFEEEVEAFIAAQDGKWVPEHSAQVKSALLSHCKPFAGKRVDTIVSADIVNVVCAYAKVAKASAMRLRGWIEQVLDYAQAHNHIEAGKANPAKLTKAMKRALPEAPASKRHLSLHYSEAPAFIEQLRAMRVDANGGISVAAHALEFIILAGGRAGETRKAVWPEFNLTDKLWTIPAARMLKGSAKVKVPHVVPLTDAMIEILVAMQAVRSSNYVFPGSKAGKPLDNKNFERMLEGMGLKGKAVTHGFRQTFANWARNVNRTAWDVVEKALSHKVGTKVAQAYDTEHPLERHRELMTAWSSYLSQKPANVTRLLA
jgi:integrase